MPDANRLSSAELMKGASNHLRGGLAAERDNPLSYFSKPATGVLKFHGIYQHEDRDLRSSGRNTRSAPWCG